MRMFGENSRVQATAGYKSGCKPPWHHDSGLLCRGQGCSPSATPHVPKIQGLSFPEAAAVGRRLISGGWQIMRLQWLLLILHIQLSWISWPVYIHTHTFPTTIYKLFIFQTLNSKMKIKHKLVYKRESHLFNRKMFYQIKEKKNK